MLDSVVIDLEQIRECCRRLERERNIVLVEPAGGLLVPLTPLATMLDLAVDLGLPFLVVARNVLDVINHAALTVTVARQCGAEILGLVLNDTSADAHSATRTNAESLRRWVQTSLLAAIPCMPDLDVGHVRSLGQMLPIDVLT